MDWTVTTAFSEYGPVVQRASLSVSPMSSLSISLLGLRNGYGEDTRVSLFRKLREMGSKDEGLSHCLGFLLLTCLSVVVGHRAAGICFISMNSHNA